DDGGGVEGTAGHRIEPIDVQAGQFLDYRTHYDVLPGQPRGLGKRTGRPLQRERVTACDPGDAPGDRTVHASAAQQGSRRLVAQVVEPDRAQHIAEVALPRRGSVAPGEQETRVLGQ